MSRLPLAFAFVATFALWPGTAHASPVLFTGTGSNGGVTLNASANFAISGNTLTITLRNAGDSTGTSGLDTPAQTLTGLFFDLPTGITLTPVSAAVAAGALVQGSSCDPGPCTGSTTNVGGEFVYGTSAANGPFTGHLGDHGISSSGYITSSSGNFNGPNLDNPDAPNGINFGVIADITASNKFNPNGGLSGRPLIEEQVVFTLTINGTVNGSPLTEANISNVSFQYGTSFAEPHFGSGSGGSGGGGQTVPEPGALLLLGSGLMGAAYRKIKQEKSRGSSL